MIIAVALVILAIFGAPLFSIIAASAMAGYAREEIDLMAIAVEIIGIANQPMLSAIPLFTFAGYLLSESNAPQRLVAIGRQCIKCRQQYGTPQVGRLLGVRFVAASIR